MSARGGEARPWGEASILPRVGAWWSARTPLFREVTVILAVKVVLILVIWFAFFRTPAAPNMTMPPAPLERHLISPASTTEGTHAVR